MRPGPFARWRAGARRFSTAPLEVKLDTLRLLGWLAASEAALRVLSLETVTRGFGVRLGAYSNPPAEGLSSSDDASRDETSAPWPPELTEEIRLAQTRVDRVLRIARPHDVCLRRSLVLGRELRRYAPVLHLGATKRSGVFLAHAWLEVRGLRVPDFGARPAEPGSSAGEAREFIPLRAFSSRS